MKTPESASGKGISRFEGNHNGWYSIGEIVRTGLVDRMSSV